MSGEEYHDAFPVVVDDGFLKGQVLKGQGRWFSGGVKSKIFDKSSRAGDVVAKEQARSHLAKNAFLPPRSSTD